MWSCSGQRPTGLHGRTLTHAAFAAMATADSLRNELRTRHDPRATTDPKTHFHLQCPTSPPTGPGTEETKFDSARGCQFEAAVRL
ncbi:unnamed protein product [Protopolystoma xenopodis]|uniref:Uncharacterized protein n=1 Tax=Protopolystoma xenopodis TaxID=117903 RepID=A0A3S5B433_9PLAT|nr:unnamed protein product [Protopolystoma xenopodis]